MSGLAMALPTNNNNNNIMEDQRPVKIYTFGEIEPDDLIVAVFGDKIFHLSKKASPAEQPNKVFQVMIASSRFFESYCGTEMQLAAADESNNVNLPTISADTFNDVMERVHYEQPYHFLCTGDIKDILPLRPILDVVNYLDCGILKSEIDLELSVSQCRVMDCKCYAMKFLVSHHYNLKLSKETIMSSKEAMKSALGYVEKCPSGWGDRGDIQETIQMVKTLMEIED